MGFVLLPGEASTADDIEACQRKLMRDRDVVRLTVVHTKKWRGAALAKLISSASAAGPRG
jgi:hypothetical protein